MSQHAGPVLWTGGLGLLLFIIGFAAAFSTVGGVFVLLGAGALLAAFLMAVRVPPLVAYLLGIVASVVLVVELIVNGV